MGSGHCGGPLRKPPPGLNMLNKVLILLIVYLGWSSSSPSPFKVFRRHSQPSLLPRVGRNSKVMLHPRDSRAKEMVTERKCKDVRVPVPETENNEVEVGATGPGTGGPARNTRRRRSPQGEPQLTGGLEGVEGPNSLGGLDGNSLSNLESDQDLLSIGEECEDWPVQKCTLEKKTVKKVNPETSCRKVPRDICAPSNCVFKNTEKVCRDEARQLVQNIPAEECDLEPREDCKMETVLVPRLIQQPNCIKVPKEICINVKANPKKVKKPVVKE